MLFVNMKDGLNALEDEILHQADILQSLGIDGIRSFGHQLQGRN